MGKRFTVTKELATGYAYIVDNMLGRVVQRWSMYTPNGWAEADRRRELYNDRHNIMQDRIKGKRERGTLADWPDDIDHASS